MNTKELMQGLTTASANLVSAAELYYFHRAQDEQAENVQTLKYWDAINDGIVGGRNQHERDASFYAVENKVVEDTMRKKEATAVSRIAFEKAKQEWKLWTYISGLVSSEEETELDLSDGG